MVEINLITNGHFSLFKKLKKEEASWSQGVYIPHSLLLSLLCQTFLAFYFFKYWVCKLLFLNFSCTTHEAAPHSPTSLEFFVPISCYVRNTLDNAKGSPGNSEKDSLKREILLLLLLLKLCLHFVVTQKLHCSINTESTKNSFSPSLPCAFICITVGSS